MTRFSREDVETMSWSHLIRHTRFYQEAFEEGKLEAIPRLLKLGLNVEQIAEALELEIDVVRQAAEKGLLKQETSHRT
ncbi:Rpn family recombination-promoting nuclease/putative transposase [Nostoc sp. CENA67]|uniref:Rpn family recombination-promoting nuclease/putative transposase n=1 Tax=Amazonocrinis nigriterrae CENA67 TaxID=2794033 RepID=A0A8J7HNZ8_9NOST|nr:Rpn family recombination-promoting nuclease/putative transposase [Amazonocrinis nigriterrae]MBH8562972.1 Rpn family recombination-promoting nuclease/putative transposase [Amazonocrinis nigriterrae CENA67]